MHCYSYSILFSLPDDFAAKAKKESNPSPKPEMAAAAVAAPAAPVEQPALPVARKETPPPAIAPTTAVNEIPIQKDSPKSLTSKEKLNKKKKNELIIQSRQMSMFHTLIPSTLYENHTICFALTHTIHRS